LSEHSVDALFDPAVVQDPFDYYRELRTNDAVHEVIPGTFIVTRLDLIHEVVGKTAIFSSGATAFLHKGDCPIPGLRPLVPGAELDAEIPGVIATADPPAHERHRKVLSKSFSTGSIRAMEPAFRELVRGALAGADGDGRLEWMSQVAEPLPMVIVARLLGFTDGDAPWLKRLGYALVERIGGFASDDRMQQLETDAMNDVGPIIEAYTRARGASGVHPDGIIAVVAQAVDDGELDEFEAMGILSVLIAAGGESTTSLLGSAVRIVAERPDLQGRLRDDPSLIPNLVEEALRYDPPFRGHYRVVTEDTALGGTAIPAGAHVVLMWPAANRDERVYEEPDHVRLDRPNPRNHVGFGWGIHLCIGAPLARLEARVALEELLAATANVRLDASAPSPTYHASLLVRRLESLSLVLERK
jgi:cytochrome P450